MEQKNERTAWIAVRESDGKREYLTFSLSGWTEVIEDAIQCSRRRDIELLLEGCDDSSILVSNQTFMDARPSAKVKLDHCYKYTCACGQINIVDMYTERLELAEGAAKVAGIMSAHESGPITDDGVVRCASCGRYSDSLDDIIVNPQIEDGALDGGHLSIVSDNN